MPVAAPQAHLSHLSRRIGWTEIAEELTAASAARAPLGGLWRREGGVAVVAGSAQTAWMHGQVDVAAALAMLGSASGVHEVYVTAAHSALIDAMVAAGWQRGEFMHHVVRDLRDAGDVVSLCDTELRPAELGPADVPRLRELLRCSGVPERMLASHYPDDFFAIAAPVRVVGITAVDGTLLGSCAVRRQGRGALGFALYVRPGSGGRGLARALVDAACRAAGEMGAEFVHAQASAAATECLQRCGFGRVGAWQVLHRG
jgi:GNAT superfamily N-acetyltransferase